jgi:NADH:ubiquinone reductase (H+-translocating)
MQNILVIGGGFAGMMAALNAADEIDQHGGDIKVTLVSPSPFITIRPRLYEKNPETLRAPLLPCFEPAGVAFVEGAAREIDTDGCIVTVESSDGKSRTLAYDRLILATGSELRELPIPGLGEHSFNIDTYDSAVALDVHLQKVVQDPEVTGNNCFAIVGAGMSGIEMAAEMRNRIELHSNAATAQAARVILLEKSDVVGPDFGEGPRPVIQDALGQANVEIMLGVSVTRIDADSVTLNTGAQIPTTTTIVTTGLCANSLSAQIPVARDELGRLPVDDMLRVKDAPGIYATGDIALAMADDSDAKDGDGGHYALMSCQHGRTMGKYAGYNAAREMMGLDPRPYRQTDYTTCLDLGNFGACFSKGWDRKVEHFGAEAKKRKMWINSELIYPPVGNKAEIFEGSRIHPETGR